MKLISILVLVLPILTELVEFNCLNGRMLNPRKFKALHKDSISIINIECDTPEDWEFIEMFSGIKSMNSLHTLIIQKAVISVGLLSQILQIQMPSLTNISVSQSTFGDDQLKKLLEFNMENITELNLMQTQVTMESFKLIRKANLTNLQKITLSRNLQLGKPAIDVLADMYLPKLIKIYTGLTGVDTSVVNTLGKFNLDQLEEFTTGHPSVQDLFMEKFSKLKLPKLRLLGLVYLKSITLEGWKQFFTIKLQSLEQLRMISSELDTQKLSKFKADKFPRLKILYLSQNMLDQSIFEILSQFNGIESVTLQKNVISTLKGLEKLNPQLKKLDFIENDVSDNQLGLLCRFKSLENLMLDKNGISDDGLEQLRGCVFENLTILSMSHNYLTNRTLEILSTMGLKSLKYLDLSNNKLGESLNKNFTLYFPKLEKLSLQSTQIGNFEAELLSKAGLDNLEMLDLSENKLDDIGLAHIGNINFTKIWQLVLDSNRFKGFGLLNFKRDSLKTLQILSMASNQLGEITGYALSRLSLEELMVLLLGNNQLNNAAMIQLSKAEVPNLDTLLLQGNKFDDEAVEQLSKMKAPYLKLLNLGSNEITGKPVAALLNTHPQIYKLGLSRCRIADDFFGYLNPNPFRISTLLLMNNFINDQFILQLSKRPDIYQKLEILMLYNNDLTDLSLQILAGLDMPELFLLILMMNEFTEAGKVQFLKNIAYPKLVVLLIDADQIDPSQFSSWSKQFVIG